VRPFGLFGERLGRIDLPEIRAFGMFGRPKLGVELIEPTPELREHFGAPSDAGVIVSRVLAGMPAEGAGVRVGDVIVAVDGHAVETAGDLIEQLHDADGETIELELIRDGRPQRIRVALPERDPDLPSGPRA
jgi:serine protease Do